MQLLTFFLLKTFHLASITVNSPPPSLGCFLVFFASFSSNSPFSLSPPPPKNYRIPRQSLWISPATLNPQTNLTHSKISMPKAGNLYLQPRPLPWTADSCIPSCLDNISIWTAILTCPKLKLFPSKNLLILQLPHLNKWKLQSSSQNPQPISNPPSNSVGSAF